MSATSDTPDRRARHRGALVELAVSDLGIIDDLRLVLGEGMTAVSGETGAGKTLVVEAIDLLVGGRADTAMVRPGAEEATVQGRFEIDGEEVVLARVVPREGRSRAYVDGRLATASSLAEWGRRLVDLHGQHSHQSLLSTASQRDALDLHAGVDLAPLADARARLAELERALGDLGGDERARAREIDLLRHQASEIDAVGVEDPDEDERLDREEDLLGDAVAHRDAAAGAVEALAGESGALDRAGEAIAAVSGRPPFLELEGRLRDAVAELDDLASELRRAAERIEDDPERLAAVRERRQALSDLRRKYGEDLASVAEFRREVAGRLDELERHEERASELEHRRERVREETSSLARDVAERRRAAAPELGGAVAATLGQLAMPHAEVSVEVAGEPPGDRVEFLITANPGSPPLPLRKVASGGELARTMLAIRLVLTVGPPVLVFDEVDAGIGGEVATEVGRALAAIGEAHQVLVVTHLPQVAAWAHHHVRVQKHVEDGTTRSSAEGLSPEERVIELARMLSGSPDSPVANDHARELLGLAGRHGGS